MKKSVILSLCILSFVGLLTSCEESDVNITNQYVDYKDGENKFTVMALQCEGMNEEEAKEVAMHRVAELTKTHGFRYFQIKREFATRILHSDRDDLYRFPGNLYQEKIQEQGFNRERIYHDMGVGAQPYSCYRIEVECYQEYPGNGAYDACDYIECKKDK